jgi:hypothetical protein
VSARGAIAARGRRARHLATRYVSSVRARTLDDETAAWVADALTPREREVWAGMSRADRAEGVAVAQAFAAGAGDDDPRWRAAALLHDAGKQVSAYGTLGRVLATLAIAGVGKARAREWAAAGGRCTTRGGGLGGRPPPPRPLDRHRDSGVRVPGAGRRRRRELTSPGP